MKNEMLSYLILQHSLEAGDNMYTYADFSTVKELPDIVHVNQLSEALGLSVSRTYEIIQDIGIPHLKLGKRFIIFKEHLIETLSGKRIYTSVNNLNAIKGLPKVFNPKRLRDALGISNGTAYVLVREPGFPAAFSRNRIVISKTGFVDWIRTNEKNMRSAEEERR